MNSDEETLPTTERNIQSFSTEVFDTLKTDLESYEIRPQDKRFPLSIVWTPLPLITWMIPCIGHTGIGDSKGVVYDFAGPYFISKDDLAFGETHKYVVLDILAEDISPKDYDKAI